MLSTDYRDPHSGDTDITPTGLKLTCPVCRFVIQESWYFCPNCGKKLKQTPLSTSFWKQAQMYSLSIFLPPLGLIPAIRYIFQKNTNAKLVGIICLLLTILSSVITVWLTTALMNQITAELTHALSPLPGLQY